MVFIQILFYSSSSTFIFFLHLLLFLSFTLCLFIHTDSVWILHCNSPWNFFFLFLSFYDFFHALSSSFSLLIFFFSKYSFITVPLFFTFFLSFFHFHFSLYFHPSFFFFFSFHFRSVFCLRSFFFLFLFNFIVYFIYFLFHISSFLCCFQRHAQIRHVEFILYTFFFFFWTEVDLDISLPKR